MVAALKFAGQAEVAAPRATVWETLMDPVAMARIVPGCRGLEHVAPGEFRARMHMGVGALRGNFVGTLRLSDLQAPAACRLALSGRGSVGEFAGQGQLRLDEQDGVTTIAYAADLTFGGPLAGLGEALMQTMARALIAQGLQNLAEACRGRSATGQ